MTDKERDKEAHTIFLAGQITGALWREKPDQAELNKLLSELDPDILREFLYSPRSSADPKVNPCGEAFRYRKQCLKVLRMRNELN